MLTVTLAIYTDITPTRVGSVPAAAMKIEPNDPSQTHKNTAGNTNCGLPWVIRALQGTAQRKILF